MCSVKTHYNYILICLQYYSYIAMTFVVFSILLAMPSFRLESCRSESVIHRKELPMAPGNYLSRKTLVPSDFEMPRGGYYKIGNI